VPESRSVADRLREEYFELLPEIRRTLVETETRIKRELLDTTLSLQRYERLLITSRVKECDSAVDALRRRQPFGAFAEDRTEEYTLTALRDLAAVRVMAFPHRRLLESHDVVRRAIAGWAADPVPAIADPTGVIAFKFFGKWNADARITAEVQVVPLLVGMFWDVEHSALYKPNPNLHGIVRSETVLQRYANVLDALQQFEREFELAIEQSGE
jgi:ppGpp synthetase/RelA/SpoT-type nucleotidyltranferase